MSKRSAYIVTGSSNGIGAAVVSALLEDDQLVLGIDREESERKDHPFLKCDLERYAADEAEQAQIHGKLREQLQGVPLKGIVHSAAEQCVAPVQDLSRVQWLKTLDVNCWSPLVLTRHFSKELRANRGSVVNIASIHASKTKSDFALYALSKAALDSLTRSLAIELSPEVRVNSVCPGAVDTGMFRAGIADDSKLMAEIASSHLVGRIAQPEEISATVCFLLSEDASFVNGTSVLVDGGASITLN